MNGLLGWAESLGEMLGERIAHQLRGRLVPEPVPPRATPPVRRTRRPAEPKRRGPGRPRRMPDVPLEEFQPRRTVEFRIGQREIAAEIVSVDHARALVRVKDFRTNEEMTRPAWQLRLVRAPKPVIRKRPPGSSDATSRNGTASAAPKSDEAAPLDEPRESTEEQPVASAEALEPEATGPTVTPMLMPKSGAGAHREPTPEPEPASNETIPSPS